MAYFRVALGDSGKTLTSEYFAFNTLGEKLFSNAFLSGADFSPFSAKSACNAVNSPVLADGNSGCTYFSTTSFGDSSLDTPIRTMDNLKLVIRTCADVGLLKSVAIQRSAVESLVRNNWITREAADRFSHRATATSVGDSGAGAIPNADETVSGADEDENDESENSEDGEDEDDQNEDVGDEDDKPRLSDIDTQLALARDANTLWDLIVDQFGLSITFDEHNRLVTYDVVPVHALERERANAQLVRVIDNRYFTSSGGTVINSVCCPPTPVNDDDCIIAVRYNNVIAALGTVANTAVDFVDESHWTHPDAAAIMRDLDATGHTSGVQAHTIPVLTVRQAYGTYDSLRDLRVLYAGVPYIRFEGAVNWPSEWAFPKTLSSPRTIEDFVFSDLRKHIVNHIMTVLYATMKGTSDAVRSYVYRVVFTSSSTSAGAMTAEECRLLFLQRMQDYAIKVRNGVVGTDGSHVTDATNLDEAVEIDGHKYPSYTPTYEDPYDENSFLVASSLITDVDYGAGRGDENSVTLELVANFRVSGWILRSEGVMRATVRAVDTVDPRDVSEAFIDRAFAGSIVDLTHDPSLRRLYDQYVDLRNRTGGVPVDPYSVERSKRDVAVEIEGRRVLISKSPTELLLAVPCFGFVDSVGANIFGGNGAALSGGISGEFIHTIYVSEGHLILNYGPVSVSPSVARMSVMERRGLSDSALLADSKDPIERLSLPTLTTGSLKLDFDDPAAPLLPTSISATSRMIQRRGQLFVAMCRSNISEDGASVKYYAIPSAVYGEGDGFYRRVDATLWINRSQAVEALTVTSREETLQATIAPQTARGIRARPTSERQSRPNATFRRLGETL